MLEPRRFMPAPALAGAGLPSDRAAQVAARRAFVALKVRFMAAVDQLPGSDGDFLRRQVRAAEEPACLWMLRGPVFEALAAGGNADWSQRRSALRRGLHSMFPDSEPPSAFSHF